MKELNLNEIKDVAGGEICFCYDESGDTVGDRVYLDEAVSMCIEYCCDDSSVYSWEIGDAKGRCLKA